VCTPRWEEEGSNHPEKNAKREMVGVWVLQRHRVWWRQDLGKVEGTGDSLVLVDAEQGEEIEVDSFRQNGELRGPARAL
jgi:hypothetical protein